ncbi:SAM-dependent methyltransferase [Streptosporangium sp. NBC_01755]|uniref:SAM-dependent methyltransferase n=1 Tax=unclassified Streptosporangium TaxID=2632669 RepID=UPI002DD80213|nr:MULTISPECIES: SAM-dependent methyltransferase [unclassified Streptosporangium]WSA28328.1 SAM-dependent methyltransferase [Streptosporangium sp. NBC_01810]WSD00194.1 SAM-dependent methyltransferase [Streptosporangium sp. NBC_01755]
MTDKRDERDVGIDTTRPSIARAYDVVLNGKDNFEVDRAFVAEIVKIVPEIYDVATYNRQVLGRGVRFLAKQGITQFIDLGSGLPTVENTHQVAQGVNPEARVVYVDNDPMVLAHGRALLAENDRTAMVTSDLRDTEAILADPAVKRLIDLDRPVGVMLVGVLHHLHDDDDPRGIVETYMAAVPSGSYLFITHFCASSQDSRDAEQKYLALLGTGRFRTPEEITAFFDGFELLEPGVVALPLWRPDGPIPAQLTVGQRLMYGGIAYKR